MKAGSKWKSGVGRQQKEEELLWLDLINIGSEMVHAKTRKPGGFASWCENHIPLVWSVLQL